jgi:hypothetical protein
MTRTGRDLRGPRSTDRRLVGRAGAVRRGTRGLRLATGGRPRADVSRCDRTRYRDPGPRTSHPQAVPSVCHPPGRSGSDGVVRRSRSGTRPPIDSNSRRSRRRWLGRLGLLPHRNSGVPSTSWQARAGSLGISCRRSPPRCRDPATDRDALLCEGVPCGTGLPRTVAAAQAARLTRGVQGEISRPCH